MGRRGRCRAVVLLAAAIVTAQPVCAATLFDPTLGTTPTAQGWNLLPPGNSSFGQTTSGLLDLNTTASRTTQAGYFSEFPWDGGHPLPAMPVLDRMAGYRVEFALKVLSEGHDARDDSGDGKLDRAGFSVIAISEDLFGLELGFFGDRVWAYEDAKPTAGNLFTQAEFALFDTTAALVDYALEVIASQYRLTQGGNLLLSGDLRNYNPSGVFALADPYDNPSFLFYGDDTTSADSHVQLGRIAVSAVPLPPALFLFALPLLGMLRLHGKK